MMEAKSAEKAFRERASEHEMSVRFPKQDERRYIYGKRVRLVWQESNVSDYLVVESVRLYDKRRENKELSFLEEDDESRVMRKLWISYMKERGGAEGKKGILIKKISGFTAKQLAGFGITKFDQLDVPGLRYYRALYAWGEWYYALFDDTSRMEDAFRTAQFLANKLEEWKENDPTFNYRVEENAIKQRRVEFRILVRERKESFCLEFESECFLLLKKEKHFFRTPEEAWDVIERQLSRWSESQGLKHLLTPPRRYFDKCADRTDGPFHEVKETIHDYLLCRYDMYALESWFVEHRIKVLLYKVCSYIGSVYIYQIMDTFIGVVLEEDRGVRDVLCTEQAEKIAVYYRDQLTNLQRVENDEEIREALKKAGN